MENDELIQVCKSCGFSGNENYCSHCGQPYQVKRISLAGLVHDIFHVFTHLDRGFGYTIKMLILKPGHMQREYIEGDRSRHQKPFSMFLICATITALVRYWIYQTLIKYYHVGSTSEAIFMHEYMVIFFIVLLPLNVFITYILFRKSGYNFAEIAVFFLYSLSFFLLVASCIALLRFIWPELDTMYVELPVLLIYNTITFINFFYKQPRWLVAVKSILAILAVFFLIQVAEDFVIRLIS
jgi:hypothetical protein